MCASNYNIQNYKYQIGYVTINSQLEGPVNNDDNISDFFHKIEIMFGLSVDHIFNSDTNYPPIYEDVTFWVISP